MSSRVFRLPRSAYLAVLFLALCVTPLVQHPLAAILYVIPVAGTVFIARTATIVNEDGIAVRALIGRRMLPWDQVRGLSVTGRNVYAVTDDGAVRLPCVRVSDLAALSGASGGRVPQLPEATPKYAPSRRRR
ncbi:MAG TPA: PH domain-containing protein [Jatrophihabitantaceae bacterium]